MAETNGSLLLHSHHASLDPTSLILSHFSNSYKPQLLKLTTESFIMERGPKFKEYSDLRDKRLRMKNLTEEKTPPKKQVKFSSNLTTPPRRAKSVLAQSVPDFSSALRKENRKPVLPPVVERAVTPPATLSKSGRVYGKVKSANSSAEKGSGGSMMARKSYANMEEFKGLAVAAGNAISGENRGGRSGRGVGRTVLGYRQF